MRKLLVVVVAAGMLALSACGGSSTASVPKCKPHATKCREVATSTGGEAWIPFVYWYVLFQNQGVAVGSSPVYRSTIPSSDEPADDPVPESELEPDPSASDDPAPSDDPSDDPAPSDEGGGDDGGGDDGGGDAGGGGAGGDD